MKIDRSFYRLSKPCGTILLGNACALARFLSRLKGTAFQQRVWSALQQLAYGESTTYGELAQRIGQPKAVRAVGGAVGRNPISILIPCHRVLGKQRELTGFGGGLPIKRHLLQLEQIDYVDHGVEFVKPKHLKKYQQK